MGQVAHVTRHTAILGHGLLGGVIAGVGDMGTDKGENTSDNLAGELPGHIISRSRERWRIVELKRMVLGRVPSMAAASGTAAEELEELHLGEERMEKRMEKRMGDRRMER